MPPTFKTIFFVMQNFHKPGLAAVLLLVCLCAACRKSEPAPDKRDWLVMADCWSLTGYETKDIVGGSWAAQTLDSCALDNCLDFRADGTAIFDEGSAKCVADDPQSVSSAWLLLAGDATLQLSVPQIPTPRWSIEDLSEKKMVLVSNVPALLVAVRLTYEAK